MKYLTKYRIAAIFFGLALFGLIHHKIVCGRWFDIEGIWDVKIMLSSERIGIEVFSHEPLILGCLVVGIVALVLTQSRRWK